MVKYIYSFSFILLILACEKDSTDIEIENDKQEFIIFDYDVNNLSISEDYALSEVLGGELQSPQLVEASGLCVSRSNPNILWSHNDSGHSNRLFAVGKNGENYGYFFLTGAGSRDYEDICIGNGPEEGKDYIYLGDIGDNHAQYNFIVIYRFPEPNAQNLPLEGVHYMDASDIERFEFEYPDGPRDAETLMIDPWTKDLYIVSKRDFRSIIYRAKFPLTSEKRTKLERLAQLPFNWAVAGDISADGKKIAIKDKNNIYYWTRELGETVIDALRRQPIKLPYVLEPQGESFGWTPNGDRYFTLSEQSGVFPPDVYGYEKQ